jgi:hypothetical protein
MFVNLVIEVKTHFWMNPKTSIKTQNFILVYKGETHCTLKVDSTKSTIYTLRVHIIRIEFALHCTFVLSKVQNPEFKPGYNVLLFPGLVLSKVQKDNNIFQKTRNLLNVLPLCSE